MILGPNHNLGEQVCHHFLGDTEVHHNVTKTHIASNHVVPDLKMPDVAQPRQIARDVEASLGICVKGVRLRARETKETEHVLSMYKLFTCHAGSNKLSRARRINHHGLFQGPSKQRNSIQIDNKSRDALFSFTDGKRGITITQQTIA